MIRIGAYNRLRIARDIEHGLILTDGEQEVLLPRRYVPENLGEGEMLRVFVLTDSEDRPVATTQRPRGAVGEFATMKAKENTRFGTFMDWGLDKDLLVPFGEQHYPLIEGRWYVVRIFLDIRTQRVIGSTKLGKFLKGDLGKLQEGQEVSLLVVETGPEGARVIIDDSYFGMIFNDEIFGRLQTGDTRTGYIKRIREDGAIAVSLQAQGYGAAIELGPKILQELRANGGFLPLSDKSSPDQIRNAFNVSKATFKKAIGTLMKAGQIEQTFHGIRLLPEGDSPSGTGPSGPPRQTRPRPKPSK